MVLAMDYGKAIVKQRWPAQQEDKRAAQEEVLMQHINTSFFHGDGSSARA